MKIFLLGAVAGYVLGARAGRGRYEQIVRSYRKVADHPAVQGAAGIARAKVSETVGDVLPMARKVAAQGTNGQHRNADARPRSGTS